MNKLTFLIAASTLIIGMFLGNILFEKEKKTSLNLVQDCATVKGQTTFSCAMHPQVQLHEKGNCPFCSMQLVAATLMPQHNPNLFKMSQAAVQIAEQTSSQAYVDMYNRAVNSPFNYSLPRRLRLGLVYNF